jgi:hypothetical protein
MPSGVVRVSGSAPHLFSTGVSIVTGTLHPPYYLRRDSFVCLAGRYYVILHLPQDKYFCIAKAQFDSLKPWIASTNHRAAAPTSYPPAEHLVQRQLAEELLERGILTTNPNQAGTDTAVDIVTPVDAFSRDSAPIRLFRCLPYALAFFRSARFADRCLRESTTARTVQRVAERKRQFAHFPRDTSPEAIQTLVAAFHLLRPCFDRKYLCLFDSLALIDFLANYSVFPSWVFGVQSEPFAAHCWVQSHGVVLNDSLDRTRGYTPLMAV